MSSASLKICTPLDLPAVRGVAPRNVLWKRSRPMITYSFMGGDTRLHRLFDAIAANVPTYCNMRLVRVGGASDLRIAFEQGGSWSYVGTDNLRVPADSPTMNFGWLDVGMNPTDREPIRVITHEIFHALGMVHEHNHPRNTIPWNLPVIYAHFAKVGWTKEQVDAQYIRRLDEPSMNYNAYDRDSLMHYWIDQSWTIGNFSVPFTYVPSAGDKAFLRSIYPYNHDVFLPIIAGDSR